MSNEIATRNATSAVSVMTEGGYKAAMGLAQTLVDSGFLPRAIQKPAQALAIILAGQEYDLPPMQSLRQIHIVEGKPTFSAELMLSLFKRRGGRTSWIESTDKRAVLKLHHPNGDEHIETFTIEDAARARVTSKDNWQKYPKAMLRARCISAGIRALGEADGVYTPEELGDGAHPDDLPEAPVITPVDPSKPYDVDANLRNQRRLAGEAPKAPTSSPAVESAASSDEPAASSTADVRGDVGGEPANEAAGEIQPEFRDLVPVYVWRADRSEWVETDKQPKLRREKEVRIKILQKEIGIPDDVYRARLRELFGKDSCTELAESEAETAIKKLETRLKTHGNAEAGEARKKAKEERQQKRAGEALRDIGEYLGERTVGEEG